MKPEAGEDAPKGKDLSGSAQGGECEGMALGRKSASRQGLPGNSEMAAQLLVRHFRKALPGELQAVGRLTEDLLTLAMQMDASCLDVPPVLETAFGAIPVLFIERCAFLKELHGHPDGRGGADAKLILATVALHERLLVIEGVWTRRLASIWSALIAVEAMASDFLASYLTSSLVHARQARDKYLYSGIESATPRASSDDFLDLRRALKRVSGARNLEDIDSFRTQKALLSAVCMGSMAVAILSTWSRAAFLADRETFDRIADAEYLYETNVRDMAARTTGYLQLVRKEAERHPILLVMHHDYPADDDVSGIATAVKNAAAKAEKAIGNLMADGVNTRTFPDQRRPEDLTCSGLAHRLADSETRSVWKLPFFTERAILELPPGRSLDVRAILELAARQSGGEAIGQSLSLFGIEAAMMAAPAAGLTGVVAAVGWSVLNIGKSIHEHVGLSELYRASVDPSLMLRESDHGEPSWIGIAFDVMGLVLCRPAKI